MDAKVSMDERERDAARLKVVIVDRISLGNYLKSPPGQYWRFAGLPDDAILVGVSADHGFIHNVVVLTYQSQEFDPVPEGEPTPPLKLTVSLVPVPTEAAERPAPLFP